MASQVLLTNLRDCLKGGLYDAVQIMLAMLNGPSSETNLSKKDLLHYAVEPTSREAVLEMPRTVALLIQNGADMQLIKEDQSVLQRAIVAAFRMLYQPEHPELRDFEVVRAWFNVISLFESHNVPCNEYLNIDQRASIDSYASQATLAVLAQLYTYSDGDLQCASFMRIVARKVKLGLRDWVYIAALRPAADNAPNPAAMANWEWLTAAEKKAKAEQVAPMFWEDKTAWKLYKEHSTYAFPKMHNRLEEWRRRYGG